MLQAASAPPSALPRGALEPSGSHLQGMGASRVLCSCEGGLSNPQTCYLSHPKYLGIQPRILLQKLRVLQPSFFCLPASAFVV